MTKIACSSSAPVFDAIADPTRRRILELLRAGEAPVGFLADESRISPSAASQHLRKLRQGGLVRVRADGTRRLYRIDLDGLEPLRAWTDSFWDGILGSFAAYVEQQEVQR